MSQLIEAFHSQITLPDVRLASAYYSILITLAKQKQTLTYGELVEKAKVQYPDSPIVQNAIAISTGRRLDVVRFFTNARNLPDLTSLVISKGTGECGPGFTRSFDPVTTRNYVFTFDWSEVSADFDGFVQHTEASIKPRKKIREDMALKLMSEHYQVHKATLPTTIRDHRELIIELIMEGLPADEAFSQMVCGA